MSFWVYIIYSDSTDTYYKGQTEDLEDRLSRHNNGWEKATRQGIPWRLVWKAEKADRSSSLDTGKKIKESYKKEIGRIYG
ncbi:MAG: GIY-YIG nuclease family protein [Marinilabiliales bacterium]|nr:GIY-YIG nuclease family protein [Marinilabiliales bacterium]